MKTVESTGVDQGDQEALKAKGIAIVRQYFFDTLGVECIKELHAPSKVVDLLFLIGLPALFAALAAALAWLDFGWLWVGCLVLQGFVLMAFGFAGHELMHRGVVRNKRVQRFFSLLFMVPLYRSPTQFDHWHARHHVSLGTADDSEGFKIDIDSTWRRVLYATVLGSLFPRRLFPRRPGVPRRRQPDLRHLNDVLRFEGLVMRLFTFGWIALAWFFPGPVLMGYVLPLVIVAPFVSTMRTVIEHSEFDARNPFQLGCFYRTNFLTRPLFFWDSGDCHFVHHTFPRIPFYRITKALRLMRPGYLAHGVIEHRSLTLLTWRWFVDERPYLSTPASVKT